MVRRKRSKVPQVGERLIIDRKKYKVIGTHTVEGTENIRVNLKREGKIFWLMIYPDGSRSNANFLQDGKYEN